MLEINYTLFIQIANFLLLLFLLNILLFRPIRRIMSQRSEETNSLEKIIWDLQDRSSKSENRIEEGMILTRKEGYEEKEGLKASGQQEERVILQEAGTEAERKIGAAKKEIGTMTADVRKALEGQVVGFSKELSEKILGRSVR